MLVKLWYRRKGRVRWLRGIEEAQPESYYLEKREGARKTRFQEQCEYFPDYEYQLVPDGKCANG